MGRYYLLFICDDGFCLLSNIHNGCVSISSLSLYVLEYLFSVALQAAVPEDCKTEPWWVPDKGHNDIVDGPRVVEYIQRLNRFVRSLDEE